jgi:hypothetical protein
VYDYSINEDTWNISQIRQGSFKALAVRKDRLVLIDIYKEQGKDPVVRIKGYPLTSYNENIITFPVEDAGCRAFLSAASDKNTLVIAYSNVKILFNQSKPIELAFPLLGTNSLQRDTYYRCLLYSDHLYLSRTSTVGERDSDNQWYYTQLPQHDEQTEHDKVPSPLDGDLLPPKHKKARLEKESAIEWKPIPQLFPGCSNLACFGKQLVTIHSGRGIEIEAYSKITNSWVVVAESEDLDRTLGEYSSIFRLDDTGELMVIECGNNHRDVHKLSIEGIVTYS